MVMVDLNIKHSKKIYSGGVETLRDFNPDVKYGELIVFFSDTILKIVFIILSVLMVSMVTNLPFLFVENFW